MQCDLHTLIKEKDSTMNALTQLEAICGSIAADPSSLAEARDRHLLETHSAIALSRRCRCSSSNR